MKKLLFYISLFGISVASVKAQVNLNQGLVAYYPFNDNANDLSGNGFNGTLVNSPVLSSDQIGRATSAYTFNGTTTYIKLGDILDSVFTKTPNATFSISGWAKTNSMSSIQGDNFIVAKSSGGTGPYQWYILHENDGKIAGLIDYSNINGTNYYELKSTTTIPVNTWFSFTLVYDGNEAIDTDRLKFYVNGISGVFSRKAGSGARTTLNTTQEITIGGTYLQSNGNPVNVYDGSIDEIRIYNRALNAAEVDSLNTFTTVLRTGLPNIANNNKAIVFYPNPSESGTFYFENHSIKEISVFDISGRCCLAEHYPDNNTIDLSRFGKGVYIVKSVDFSGTVHLSKLIY